MDSKIFAIYTMVKNIQRLLIDNSFIYSLFGIKSITKYV